jgi:toxin YoeB
MGKFRLEIEEIAKLDIAKHFKIGNNANLNKIEAILKELSEHPFTGVGKPEKLKHDLKGYWSRRINQKDRIIYKVQENIVTVFVVTAMGHYDDK